MKNASPSRKKFNSVYKKGNSKLNWVNAVFLNQPFWGLACLNPNHNSIRSYQGDFPLTKPNEGYTVENGVKIPNRIG